MAEQEGHDLQEAMREANEAFGRIQQAVERAVEGGATEVDVVDVAQEADLELSEKTLAHLQVNRIIYCHPWFPWRPLWCWWWHRYYPWYRSCPWWWHRCHSGSCC